MKTVRLTLEPYDTARLANLCGHLDENLRLLEKSLAIEIRNRGNVFEISGDAIKVIALGDALHQLYEQTLHQDVLPDDIHLLIRTLQHPHPVDTGGDDIELRTRKGLVKPRSKNQARYLRQILTHDISFGVGPAGTGKTWLAVACAVDALERDEVRRIILTRPAVEAGERLGFLPGDLTEKVDPYLRPLYDALYEMLGFEKVGRLMEKHVIEVAPLAYMRGRTLNSAFIILDEAQNTTPEQMKMFLTRIGFGSRAVITGDPSQIDLPSRSTSGLIQALEVLANEKTIGVTHFEADDVVRHPIVQKVVMAYARYDAQKTSATQGKKRHE